MKKKTMRILLLANMYPSSKYPHYGIFVKNTEAILREMEEVYVKNVIMHKYDQKLVRLTAYCWLYLRVFLLACSGRYNILYGHFISHISFPIRLIRKFNKKIIIIVNVHGNDIVPDLEKDKKLIPLVKKTIPHVDHFIVPSEYFRQIMINEYSIAENDMSIFASGGVNTTVFHYKEKQSIYEKYSLQSNTSYIGYVSRIEKNKGWDTFLNMIVLFKERSDVKFIVVGDGDEIIEFEQQIHRLDINENIIKFNLLNQSEISDLFNIMDIFCFPTHRKSESLGLVGLEAMACGAIVIASNRFGPSTYMKDMINGLTFDSCNATDLYNSIEKVLMMSAEEKQEIRENALHTVKQYDVNNIKVNFINIFENLRNIV